MNSNFNIDHHRHGRTGFSEIVFGKNKDIRTLHNIMREILNVQGKVLVTKLQPEKYAVLKAEFSPFFYDEVSQTGIVGVQPTEETTAPRIAILSGGSSDEFVVNEAYFTLRFLGVAAQRYIDVGVAGIHRLLERVDELRSFDVLIVCAGFEGALPTIVGGLFPQPVIGVPVSVGYGVSESGMTALHAMLASCANGITVVNIDNGFGAAMAAYRIINTNKPR